MTSPDPALDAALEQIPPASTVRGKPGHDTTSELSRSIRALTLRIGGASYARIAQELGYSDPAAARNLITRALNRRETDLVDDLRAIENARLDSDEVVLRTIINNPASANGDRLRAIDTRTRVSARRARMNGLDAPVQVQVSAGIQQELTAALDELEQALTVGEVLSVHDEPL